MIQLDFIIVDTKYDFFLESSTLIYFFLSPDQIHHHYLNMHLPNSELSFINLNFILNFLIHLTSFY
jgi:hypothetical protein